MKRFFDWLLTIFRPNKTNYVRNIQDGKSEPTASGGGYSGKKRKRFSNSLLAWCPTAQISLIEKNQQGVIEKLMVKKDGGFAILAASGSPVVESKKKGLSAVAHNLSFSIQGTDQSAAECLKQAQAGTPISFIYRSVYGDSILLGEKNGLHLKNEEGAQLRFAGEEADVFFHISEECLNELLPNIEK